MAIFHLHVKNISRGGRGKDVERPRSALAAAAYRAGETLWNAAEEKDTKFGGRRDVVHAEIRAPAGVPDWMRTRATLWNGVEAAEKRRDARLAKEIEFALPRELNREAWLRITREIADAYVSQGLVVDLAIHEDGRGENPHAHLMLTTRTITPDGFGAKLRWLDPDTFVLQARKLWETVANTSLAAVGVAPIDARSHVERGFEQTPSQHRGPDPTERRQHRESAAMLRTQTALTDMIRALDAKVQAFSLDDLAAHQTGKLREGQAELIEEFQKLQDSLSDALVDAGILKRDAAAQFWAMQRRLLSHEDYARERQRALGFEFYADEPHYKPSAADQRALEAYERQQQEEEWAATDAAYAAAHVPVFGDPGDPVPDPDGRPISTAARDMAETRLLDEMHAPAPYLIDPDLSDVTDRAAAQDDVDRINETPLSEEDAQSYRLPHPTERLSPAQIRAAVREAPRTPEDREAVVQGGGDRDTGRFNRALEMLRIRRVTPADPPPRNPEDDQDARPRI